jgi:hypothetical protein
MENGICCGDEQWISVSDVKPLEDYELDLTFSDGLHKLFDMRPIIERYSVFAPLKELDVFMRGHSDGYSVVWPGDIDISPDLLYEKGLPA